MNAAVILQGIHKQLGKKEILKDINFSISPGDIFGYLGPNGAGKTTTIRIILGLFKPDSGDVRILGKNVEDNSARERIGFVLEADGLYDNLSGYENLDYYAKIYAIPLEQARARIKELLQLVGLSERATDKVATYSKGMRQKLALARAIVHEPELLILDEPTAGIDPSGQIEVRDIILNMAHQRGKTIFLSSHNLDEVQRICNRIALIDKGEIKLSGELEKLRQEMGKREVIIETGITSVEQIDILESILIELQSLPYVSGCRREGYNLLLNLNGHADISELVAILARKNISVESIRKGEASLEEIYAKAVKGMEQ